MTTSLLLEHKVLKIHIESAVFSTPSEYTNQDTQGTKHLGVGSLDRFDGLKGPVSQWLAVLSEAVLYGIELQAVGREPPPFQFPRATGGIYCGAFLLHP